nr:hypothetical protein [Virgisporangium aurantiacum]
MAPSRPAAQHRCQAGAEAGVEAAAAERFGDPGGDLLAERGRWQRSGGGHLVLHERDDPALAYVAGEPAQHVVGVGQVEQDQPADHRVELPVDGDRVQVVVHE